MPFSKQVINHRSVRLVYTDFQYNARFSLHQVSDQMEQWCISKTSILPQFPQQLKAKVLFRLANTLRILLISQRKDV